MLAVDVVGIDCHTYSYV